MNSALSKKSIDAFRQTGGHGLAIEVVAQTGSTNADLLGRIGMLTCPTLLVAELQTAGRGRAGRSWHATPGAALTFSLAWKFTTTVSGLAGLPLAVGVAIAETLAALNIDVRLKWPNDILRNGNKLAGVLIETASVKDPPGGVWAVIGIGINMMVSAEMAKQIDRPVADLSQEGLDRNRLLAALADALPEALIEFDRTGFATFASRWNQMHAYAGQEVAITEQGRVLQQGKAVGVDHIGRLLLNTKSGEVAITAGDVSLRAREG